MKTIILFASFFLVQFTLLSQKSQSYGTAYVDINVDSLPSFPGGEFMLYDFISQNFIVSQTIKNESGPHSQSLVLSFVVDTTGQILESQVFQSGNIYVENEMLRMTRRMPAWQPALKNGQKVKARIYIPLQFYVEETNIRITNTGGSDAVVGRTTKTRGLKIALMTIALSPVIVVVTASSVGWIKNSFK